MQPIDWQAMWSPDIHPLEVALRATLVYLFAQLVMRLIGRKELGRYSNFDVVLLFLVTVALRRVRAAYMEPDGKVTFLMKKEEGEGSSLQ